MTADQNKEVVRGFITVILMEGRFDRIDEFFAPGYVNRAFGVDLAGFKAMLPAFAAVLPERQFDVEELIAEGNAVVARYTSEMRDQDRRTIAVRGLTYYRLADGKIVEDDPITSPELARSLAPFLAPATA